MSASVDTTFGVPAGRYLVEGRRWRQIPANGLAALLQTVTTGGDVVDFVMRVRGDAIVFVSRLRVRIEYDAGALDPCTARSLQGWLRANTYFPEYVLTYVDGARETLVFHDAHAAADWIDKTMREPDHLGPEWLSLELEPTTAPAAIQTTLRRLPRNDDRLTPQLIRWFHKTGLSERMIFAEVERSRFMFIGRGFTLMGDRFEHDGLAGPWTHAGPDAAYAARASAIYPRVAETSSPYTEYVTCLIRQADGRPPARLRYARMLRRLRLADGTGIVACLSIPTFQFVH